MAIKPPAGELALLDTARPAHLRIKQAVHKLVDSAVEHIPWAVKPLTVEQGILDPEKPAHPRVKQTVNMIVESAVEHTPLIGSEIEQKLIKDSGIAERSTSDFVRNLRDWFGDEQLDDGVVVSANGLDYMPLVIAQRNDCGDFAVTELTVDISAGQTTQLVILAPEENTDEPSEKGPTDDSEEPVAKFSLGAVDPTTHRVLEAEGDAYDMTGRRRLYQTAARVIADIESSYEEGTLEVLRGQLINQDPSPN